MSPWAIPAAPRAPLGVYLLLGGALLLLCACTAAANEWLSDTWIHSATISEVARRPFAPRQPLTGTDDPFPYFSPYAMLLGWVMHLTGLPAMAVLTVGGLISACLLLWTWWRLVRAVTSAPWAPVVALVLLVTLWGSAGLWYWSGFLVLGTWSVGFTWPSVLAGAGWFELWRTALRLEQCRRSRVLATFLVLPGLLILVHPFTALIAAVAVVVTLGGRLSSAPGRVGAAVGASAVSVLLAAWWPWIHLPDLLRGTAGFDEIHAALFGDLAGRYGLLLLTLPALWLRLWADRRDPLAWTAMVLGLVIGLGAALGWYSLGRLLPGVAVSGQLALAAFLGEQGVRWPALPLRSRLGVGAVAAVTAGAAAIGLWAERGALLRAWPVAETRAAYARAAGLEPPYPDLSFVRPHVAQGGIAISNDWRLARQLPTNGLYTVAPQWPSPGLSDATERTRAEAAILSPTTSAPTRADLLSRWRVRWIVWRPETGARGWPYAGARRVACGPSGIALLEVDPAAGRPRACGPAGSRTPAR